MNPIFLFRYGDIVPRRFFTRIIIVGVMITGLIVASILTAFVTEFIVFNKNSIHYQKVIVTDILIFYTELAWISGVQKLPQIRVIIIIIYEFLPNRQNCRKSNVEECILTIWYGILNADSTKTPFSSVTF